jgi:hypothetical protein
MKKTVKPLEKPTPPVAPKFDDFPREKGVKSTLENPTPYVLALQKHYKEQEKYKAAVELYEQTKFIMDIQRSSLALCLKKYKVTKK